MVRFKNSFKQIINLKFILLFCHDFSTQKSREVLNHSSNLIWFPPQVAFGMTEISTMFLLIFSSITCLRQLCASFSASYKLIF
jgi:hypothetical protein